jgi:NADPH-dependent 2,4-dienoyl-CoA reductase/sulfur reductase-like enzyme
MRLLVIGASAAGLSAATHARRLDPSLSITVLEKGQAVSLGLCGLPYFVEGRVPSWAALVAKPASYFEGLRIEIRTGVEVSAIQHARRRVRTAAGEEIPYDKLVFAAGARPVQGPENSFAIATLEGAIRLREHLESARGGHAWIAGGGYIGLEAAEALRSRGWRVSLSHAGPHLLGRDDPWLTARLAEHLARCRVEVRLDDRAGHARGADLLLWAAGLRPNVELAAEAGVEVGRSGAIAADDRMETNLPSLLAAGDCVEARHRVTGRSVWMPLGTTANKMGRVAGAAAAGHRERFHGIVGTSIVRVCGLGVGLTGLSESQARAEGFDPAQAVVEARDRAAYFRARPVSVQLVADRRSGRLLGGAVLGEYGVEGRINVIATALTARLPLEELASLDLAYAPPYAPVWDAVLIAARQLLKLLH